MSPILTDDISTCSALAIIAFSLSNAPVLSSI
jgi:hypothetical protein